MAAQLASVAVYEQQALQEGLGQPERAAQARAKAERAREFHRLAGAEVAEYLARIKAARTGGHAAAGMGLAGIEEPWLTPDCGRAESGPRLGRTQRGTEPGADVIELPVRLE
jgi:hypothetical protein